MPIRSFNLLRCRPGSTPRTLTWPASRVRNPSKISTVVVFPAPLGPSRAKISPTRTDRSTRDRTRLAVGLHQAAHVYGKLLAVPGVAACRAPGLDLAWQRVHAVIPAHRFNQVACTIITLRTLLSSRGIHASPSKDHANASRGRSGCADRRSGSQRRNVAVDDGAQRLRGARADDRADDGVTGIVDAGMDSGACDGGRQEIQR